MSWLNPRTIAIGGGVIGGALLLFPRSSAKVLPDNVFETQAVKSIGDRFSAGGGAHTHTPGVATKRGDSENVASRQENPTGVNTEAFKNTMADQKVGEPSAVGKKFNQAQYGSNEKGK